MFLCARIKPSGPVVPPFGHLTREQGRIAGLGGEDTCQAPQLHRMGFGAICQHPVERDAEFAGDSNDSTTAAFVIFLTLLCGTFS